VGKGLGHALAAAMCFERAAARSNCGRIVSASRPEREEEDGQRGALQPIDARGDWIETHNRCCLKEEE